MPPICAGADRIRGAGLAHGAADAPGVDTGGCWPSELDMRREGFGHGLRRAGRRRLPDTSSDQECLLIRTPRFA